MYDVRDSISLAAVIADGAAAGVITNTGRAVGSVTVLELTAGARCFIRVGNAQWVPVSSTGVLSGFDPLNEGKQGVFLRNDTAQAGATVSLLIGFVSDRDVAALQAASKVA